MTKNNQSILRFTLGRRLEHYLLIASFSTLAVTGLVQKFSMSPISIGIISFLGGIEITRIIHRTAAIILVLQTVYHFVLAGYLLYVKRRESSMLPGPKDALDAFQALLYNLGLRKEAPKMGRYNFAEKMEYWAMIWGTVLMAITGFMLWNPIATSNVLPGQFIPAAKTAHGMEAILAVAAIILWHFYNVHIKTFNKSIFTGKISRHEMEEEHALELEQIESGKIPPPPPVEAQRKRKLIYFAVTGVLTVLFVIGLYRFLTFQETAITTIPPVPDAVDSAFVPRTPTPRPTPLPMPTRQPTEPSTGPSEPLTWSTGIADIVGQRCSACHGSMGGLAVDTYANLMRGGNSGPVIVAGDAANSRFITILEGGRHPGNFEPDELEAVIAWINSGAEE